MSEYQYHEWQTIDRVLTPQEQMDVDSLSSHIEVTASRAVVTYHWSDFRHNPKQVLLDYFDAYFYCANWGTLQLMFRFPKGLVDKEAIAPYCDGEIISFESRGNYDVLDLSFYADGYYPGNGWMEAERGLSGFIRLRDDLIDGDYRLLYLAWLCARTTRDNYGYELEEEYNPTNSPELEPPVPSGLDNLSASLQYFITVFDVNEHLVQAAAEKSEKLKKGQKIDYQKLVPQLSRTECDDFLIDLAEGKPGTALALRKRLSAFLPPKKATPYENPRSVQQIEDRAINLEKEKKKRLAEEARQRHITEMNALAQREEQAWEEVDQLIGNGRKIASVYDNATEKLRKLAQLAEFKQTYPAFQSRIQALAEKYASRNALIGRWRREGWVTE
ncbi:MAG: hypothetical protein PVG14_09445 [Anaerolineales bacterium]|jgi:hypothetical protein